MNFLVSFFCFCLAVASAKPFYVVPTTYTSNYATPYVFGQPTQYVVSPQFRSTFPFQQVSGVPTATVLTRSETPTLKTPFITQEVVPTFKSVITPFDSTITRYQTQNTDGSYTFGYSGGPSSRAETRDKFGTVNGVFNYIDPTGKVQTQQYTADAQGFRVAGTNLPVAPYAKITDTATNVVTVNRKKREATTTELKTPASTVPLKQVYTTAEVTPRVVYTQIPGYRTPQTPVIYPFFPTAYSVPSTNFVDNTIVKTETDAETVFVDRSLDPKTVQTVPFQTVPFQTVPANTVPFVTGKSQPFVYNPTYPFFTYTPTNVVQTVKDDTITGRTTPVVYNSAVPYNTFTPTGFVQTYTDRVVKPTTGYTFYY